MDKKASKLASCAIEKDTPQDPSAFMWSANVATENNHFLHNLVTAGQKELEFKKDNRKKFLQLKKL